MNSQVLEQLKRDMDAQVEVLTIDYNFAYAKFVEVSDDMNTFTRAVHTYFFAEYMTKYEVQIGKALARLFDINDEVLLTSVINKLALKLPMPNLSEYGYISDYDNDAARCNIASIIWHVLLDTKQVNFKRETKRVGSGWQTITTIFLGGNATKDLLRGLHFKPGRFYQKKVEDFVLPSAHKKRGKALASIPFTVSDVATAELIQKGYELNKDWDRRTDSNGNKLPEHHTNKKERYAMYRDLIVGLKGEVFYLELKYAASGRMFYKFQLEGMRPQGKHWETLMIDSANEYHLTDEQQLALKHHIYCGLNDVRVTPQEVEAKWDEELLQQATDIDPMTAKDDEEFGKFILLNKAAKSLAYAIAGIPTKYIFGWDFTTSGLIVAGTSFRSVEMMKGGNMHTEGTVYDAHTNFNEMLELGMSRKDAKKVHQPLLHGGTWKGLLDIVHEVKESDELTMDELKERLYKAYGSCVENIIDIADWGTEVVNNTQTKVSWTLPDGFRATHKAYFQSAHVKIFTVSCDDKHKSGITSHTIIKDMPVKFDVRNRPITVYTVDSKTGKYVPATVKIRGLYANITHSLDAYVLRHVADAVMLDSKPIMLKHDDFMVHPSSYETVLLSSQHAFNKLYATNHYQVALKEIASKSVDKDCMYPELLVGNAKNVVDESASFLMP